MTVSVVAVPTPPFPLVGEGGCSQEPMFWQAPACHLPLQPSERPNSPFSPCGSSKADRTYVHTNEIMSHCERNAPQCDGAGTLVVSLAIDARRSVHWRRCPSFSADCRRFRQSAVAPPMQTRQRLIVLTLGIVRSGSLALRRIAPAPRRT